MLVAVPRPNIDSKPFICSLDITYTILEVQVASYLMALFILCYTAILYVLYLAPPVIRLKWNNTNSNIMSLQSMPTYVCQSRLMSVCLSKF